MMPLMFSSVRLDACIEAATHREIEGQTCSVCRAYGCDLEYELCNTTRLLTAIVKSYNMASGSHTALIR